jgi:hypothetical protein
MKLQAVRGDTNVFDVTMVRQNAVVDLTGAKMWFTAKSDQAADDTSAVIKLNSVDNPTKVLLIGAPTIGKFQIQLDPTDTSPLTEDAYYYDIQVKEGNGVVTTIASGVLHIVWDVTRSIS